MWLTKSKGSTLLILLLTSIVTIALFIQSENCAAESIHFAEKTWTIRTGSGNPGNNIWSADNVDKDSAGRVHLKIDRESGRWTCASISTQVNDYGKYRFYVIGRLNRLPENVVVGFFLYKNDYHELDIEFAKPPSTVIRGSHNAGYTVQSGGHEPFNISLNGTWSTHYIDWHPNSVNFKSIHGHHREPSWSTLIKEWRYNGTNIPQGKATLIINIWLDGSRPGGGRPAEVIIKDVDFPT